MEKKQQSPLFLNYDLLAWWWRYDVGNIQWVFNINFHSFQNFWHIKQGSVTSVKLIYWIKLWEIKDKAIILNFNCQVLLYPGLIDNVLIFSGVEAGYYRRWSCSIGECCCNPSVWMESKWDRKLQHEWSVNYNLPQLHRCSTVNIHSLRRL